MRLRPQAIILLDGAVWIKRDLIFWIYMGLLFIGSFLFWIYMGLLFIGNFLTGFGFK